MPPLAKRAIFAALAAGLFVLARPARPDEPKAKAAVEETTEVKGAVPQELVGRWLVVGAIKLPDGESRPSPTQWEIRRGPEHLELFLGRHPFPPAVTDKFNAAGAAGKTWAPEPDDMRQIAEAWETTAPPDELHTKIENRLLGSDAYPAELQSDEATKDSEFAVTVKEIFAGQTVGRTYSVYGVREHTPSTLSGGFLTSSLAMAPFPIPITLKGDFKAYRIEGPPPRSWLQRLFSGCRRG